MRKKHDNEIWYNEYVLLFRRMFIKQLSTSNKNDFRIVLTCFTKKIFMARINIYTNDIDFPNDTKFILKWTNGGDDCTTKKQEFPSWVLDKIFNNGKRFIIISGRSGIHATHYNNTLIYRSNPFGQLIIKGSIAHKNHSRQSTWRK
jgi:hypothetical protein